MKVEKKFFIKPDGTKIEAENIVQKSIVFKVKSIDAESRIVRGVVGSDDSMDRHGENINPKGWFLDNFKNNPVILLNHDYWSMPIGKAIKVAVEDNQLIFDIQFSKKYKKAITAFDLLQEGIFNAWSVGFIVLKWGAAGSDYSIDEMELLELSLVTVPANPNALTPRDEEKMKEFEKIETTSLFDKKEKVKTEKKEIVEEKKDDKTETKEVKSEKKVKVVLTEKKKAVIIALIKEVFDQSLDEKLPEAISKYLGNKAIDPKVEVKKSKSSTFAVLNRIHEELKHQNKGSGKTLKNFNHIIGRLEKSDE